MSTRRIDEIIIGIRHRKDKGDVSALAASIREVGLLHPIVIRSDGVLIAGERRLAACKTLGWTEVPITEVNLSEVVRGELAENAHRKDFLPSEIEAIRRAMLPIETEAARQRMSEGGGDQKSADRVGKISTPDTGRTRDRIGAFAGISGRTVDKIAAVVEAAEAEPEKFGKLLQDMDRSGRVEAPFRRLNVARKAEAIRKEPAPLPGRGPYRVIAADPPWPYEFRNEDPSHRGVCPYPSMTIAQICAMPVASIADENSILWLWVTNFHMRFAYQVLDAWGFSERTVLTWVKNKFGTGDWLRGMTEHCILAVRGKPTHSLTNETTVLYARVREHSRKPELFYELVERTCPAPRYAELFQRYPRENWDGHGSELQPITPGTVA